ncbi:MAG: hypothetical protein ABI792_01235 [bacterium]
MRNLFFIIGFVYLFSGCGKKESSDEIKIRHPENKSTYSGTPEKRPSDESATLKTISSKEVKLHIGDSLNIEGYVADIYLSDKVAYLNFENKFPKNIFTCTIFSGKLEQFGDLSKYKGRNVLVTGRISSYKNKPQVVLNFKDQIRIIN